LGFIKWENESPQIFILLWNLSSHWKTHIYAWAPHYYILPMTINWWEKNELILWKLSSIQMKILNDIEYYLNWVELNSNSIEYKRDVNWVRNSFPMI
jgi:hypothetical protein